MNLFKFDNLKKFLFVILFKRQKELIFSNEIFKKYSKLFSVG